MLTSIAAVAAAVLLIGNAGFQVALAAGVPWGKAAFGGRAAREDGTLPAPYRGMSAGTAVVMVLVAWLVLARGGVVGSGPLSDAVVFWGCWVVVGLMALNTVGNLANEAAALSSNPPWSPANTHRFGSNRSSFGRAAARSA